MEHRALPAVAAARLVRRLGAESDGQTITEYALILGFVSLVALLAITTAGAELDAAWDQIAADIAAAFGG